MSTLWPYLLCCRMHQLLDLPLHCCLHPPELGAVENRLRHHLSYIWMGVGRGASHLSPTLRCSAPDHRPSLPKALHLHSGWSQCVPGISAPPPPKGPPGCCGSPEGSVERNVDVWKRRCHQAFSKQHEGSICMGIGACLSSLSWIGPSLGYNQSLAWRSLAAVDLCDESSKMPSREPVAFSRSWPSIKGPEANTPTCGDIVF